MTGFFGIVLSRHWTWSLMSLLVAISSPRQLCPRGAFVFMLKAMRLIGVYTFPWSSSIQTAMRHCVMYTLGLDLFSMTRAGWRQPSVIFCLCKVPWRLRRNETTWGLDALLLRPGSRTQVGSLFWRFLAPRMEATCPTEAQIQAAIGAVLGACVGDAAGAPLENLRAMPTKSQVQSACNMCGGGAHSTAPGQITDDGEQTLSMVRGLLECGKGNFFTVSVSP